MEFDLHIHSHRSFDCKMTPRRIIATAIRAGLTGIAVVDHDTYQGGVEAREIAPQGFVVIPGIEKTTDKGDIIGLFVEREIDTKDPMEVILRIKEAGGIAVMPHPTAHLLESMPREILAKLDVLEGFNARYHKHRNMDISKGVPHVAEVARNLGKTTIGVSDAHDYGAIGRGRTIIPALSADEVRGALLRGTTLCARGPERAITRIISGLMDYLSE